MHEGEPMTFYALLGIVESATSDEIKTAFRRAAKECHPDHHPGDHAKEERFKRVAVAYEELGDPEKRSTYDTELRVQRQHQQEQEQQEERERREAAQRWQEWLRACEQAQREQRARHEREQHERAVREQAVREQAERERVRQQQATAPLIRDPMHATRARSGDGAGGIVAAVFGGLLFAGLSIAAAAAYDRGTSHWDPSVGRRRGMDGRFRRG